VQNAHTTEEVEQERKPEVEQERKPEEFYTVTVLPITVSDFSGWTKMPLRLSRCPSHLW